MTNQRILAATQLQLDKKRKLTLLSRAAQEHTNFDHEQERLIAIKSQHHQLHQQEVLLSRSETSSQ